MIAGCTALLFVLQMLGMQAMQDEVLDDPRPGFNALYIARYAVGVNQLFPNQAQPILLQFDAVTAASPFEIEGRIRSTILAGEIAGPEAVATRADSLKADFEPDVDTGTDKPADATARQDASLVHSIYAEHYTPTKAESNGLIERHGWFGELAATHNLPRNDADRRAVRRSGTWMMLGVLGLWASALIGGIVGLGLLITLIVLIAMRKQTLACPAGVAGHPTAYLETTALFLVLFIALQVVIGLIQLAGDFDLTLVLLLGAPVALLWPLLNGVSWSRYKQDMGYHCGRGVWREIGAGFVGYLAGLPIIAVGMGITYLITSLAKASADHPMQYELMDAGVSKLVILVGAAVVWAPLVEESVFRCAFYRHLRQVTGVPGWMLATVVSSFVFAAIHPQGFAGIPALMAIAFVLAGMREWRGSAIPSIFAHALHNGALVVLMGVILYA
ncbi:MAG: type II CAAX endopeptidase family protein [Planctomycetota bacterium]